MLRVATVDIPFNRGKVLRAVMQKPSKFLNVSIVKRQIQSPSVIAVHFLTEFIETNYETRFWISKTDDTMPYGFGLDNIRYVGSINEAHGNESTHVFTVYDGV